MHPLNHPGPQYTAALAVARTLRDAGHQAFFAGGCVRDLHLGLVPQDYDVATSATPDQITALFPSTLQVGAHFGVVLVCKQIDGTDTSTEVATFRHDGAYSDGRRPDAVRFSTDPREDVLRRDFTINGLLLDPFKFEETGSLAAATLDYVGGLADLARGVVRAIGDPKLRYAEDKLRMLRAVRFAARLNFHLEVEGIRCQAAEITQVSAERIRDELTRILTEGGARRGFELLYQLGLLARVLPEVVRLRGVAQPPQFHPEGDVWTHTMLMLEMLGASAESSSQPPAARVPHSSQTDGDEWETQVIDQTTVKKTVSPTLAWGVLLHDIGKPATFQPPDPKIPGDRIRFNGHVEAGVRIAEDILNRLRFSNEEKSQIIALVKNHMRFSDVLHMKQSTLRRFLRLPHFDEHLELHRLDAGSAHGDLTLYHFARAQYEAEPPADLRPAPLLTGSDLIAAGYRPSPQFKPMLALVEDAQLEGSITTREQALALIHSHYPPPQQPNPPSILVFVTHSFDIGPVPVGRGQLFLIAGPCVLESESHARVLADSIQRIAADLGIPYIFKASYDKANRTSIRSFRGPGLVEGARILRAIAKDTGLPILTDVHTPEDCLRLTKALGDIEAVLQIPAFLCRQTDLLIAAAHTGRAINIKKGQFVAPADMQHAVLKVRDSAATLTNPKPARVFLTERGASFGYNNLVVDMRALPTMRRYAPVVFDATHSVQTPSAASAGGPHGQAVSGGQPEFIPVLARAAVAAGVDGIFLEVHDDPAQAKSDGANALRLDKLRPLLEQLLAVHAAVAATTK